MPNWCYNILQFESKKPIREFLAPFIKKNQHYDETNESYTFEFDRVATIPEPLKITATFSAKDPELLDKYRENTEKYGAANWYEWCVKNWGTKWEGTVGRFDEEGTTFSFETAWSPPIPIIEKLRNILSDTENLILHYIEPGMGFCGMFIAGAEGNVDEVYNNIADAPKEMLDYLGYYPEDYE